MPLDAATKAGRPEIQEIAKQIECLERSCDELPLTKEESELLLQLKLRLADALTSAHDGENGDVDKMKSEIVGRIYMVVGEVTALTEGDLQLKIEKQVSGKSEKVVLDIQEKIDRGEPIDVVLGEPILVGGPLTAEQIRAVANEVATRTFGDLMIVPVSKFSPH